MVQPILSLACFCLTISYAVAQLGCIAPPIECPSENVTFFLYTRSNPDNPHQLLALKHETLESAPWVQGAPIKILIHGFQNNKDTAPNRELRPAYLQTSNCNVISIDYSELVKSPCYIQAARNTEIAGKCTAQLIDVLVKEYHFALSQFHIIGFSLGGQVAGYTSNYATSGQLERISALDAALPLFVTPDRSRKVDASDAKVVDALHTNAFQLGKLESIGTVDFYANGGFVQPGCVTTSNGTIAGCSHARAPAYFAESILTDVGFYGYKCPSLNFLSLCKPNLSNEMLFGEYMPLNASGLYFFETNSAPPYAKGPRN